MTLPGLVAARNLSDVVDREKAWDSLGSSIFASLPSGIISFTIKGRDILALEGVRNTSVRDFVHIKGLSALAQPRISAAATAAASGAILRDNALLKASPSSIGNYSFPRGFLDGQNLQVNGLSVASISTSPFSGNTATVPLSFSFFGVPANWRFSQPMASGTITSPDKAIPVETDAFIFYAKAGQS